MYQIKMAGSKKLFTCKGPLAQSVEQEAFNLCVIGSNPIRPTILATAVSKVQTTVWQDKKFYPTLSIALVAQLDRVLGFEPRCRGFESLRARHLMGLPQIRGHFTHPHSTLTLNL